MRAHICKGTCGKSNLKQWFVCPVASQKDLKVQLAEHLNSPAIVCGTLDCTRLENLYIFCTAVGELKGYPRQMYAIAGAEVLSLTSHSIRMPGAHDLGIWGLWRSLNWKDKAKIYGWISGHVWTKFNTEVRKVTCASASAGYVTLAAAGEAPPMACQSDMS